MKEEKRDLENILNQIYLQQKNKNEPICINEKNNTATMQSHYVEYMKIKPNQSAVLFYDKVEVFKKAFTPEKLGEFFYKVLDFGEGKTIELYDNDPFLNENVIKVLQGIQSSYKTYIGNSLSLARARENNPDNQKGNQRKVAEYKDFLEELKEKETKNINLIYNNFKDSDINHLIKDRDIEEVKQATTQFLSNNSFYLSENSVKKIVDIQNMGDYYKIIEAILLNKFAINS